MNEPPMPAYMEPQWFFPLFAVMWFGISALLSRIGGWSSLAAHFRAAQPATGEHFRFVSGSMGEKFFPVSYGGCLFVAINDNGLHLSILFLFRFQSPPLFIPWSQVESVEQKRLLFLSYTVIRVRDQWPTISIRGRAGHCIKDAYAAASSQYAA
jgi:hypothetical protein